MATMEYIAKPIVTPRDAIASHIRWKITLLTAARLRERLSERATRSIEHPDECSIRRWLISNHTRPLRETQAYRSVLDRHMEFHREMQEVARLLNSDRFEEAEQRLRTGPFEEVSLVVANALMALERAARVAS